MDLQELKNVDGGSFAVTAAVVVSVIIYVTGVYVGCQEKK